MAFVNGTVTWPLLLLLVAVAAGCGPGATPRTTPLFTENPPADPKYREEIEYMAKIANLSPDQDQRIREKVAVAAESLSMPKSVLWCVLFQESRLDRLKNAFNTQSAKGIGQFTSIALEEVNTDTGLYDPRTHAYLEHEIGPRPLPISFAVKEQMIKNQEPVAPRTSYYRLDTGVASTAVYLNNRYRHLLKTMDKRDLDFDPEVLWLFAAAAYNKGPRAMNVFLHRLRSIKGASRVRAVLHDPEELIEELSDTKSLHRIYYYLWEKKIRTPYVKEMGANIKAISRCAIDKGAPSV